LAASSFVASSFLSQAFFAATTSGRALLGVEIVLPGDELLVVDLGVLVLLDGLDDLDITRSMSDMAASNFEANRLRFSCTPV
jgi:hypothetical protein